MISALGRYALKVFGALGRLMLVFGRTLWRLPSLDRRELTRALVLFGYQSLPLTLFIATLAGATVVLQTSLYVERYGARGQLGWAAGYAIFWEFGPLLLGLMMAARIGARNAAELALLKVGGQLEGLRGISLDPFALLVAPRVLGACLSVTALAAVTFAVAIVFEIIAATLMLGLPPRVFIASLSSMLAPSDLLGGVLKSFFFGGAIAVVSSAIGLEASGGARGVGRAASTSVVFGCASIFALDYVLTPLLTRALGS